MDYKNTIFIIVKPPSKIISAHKVTNITEHNDLLEKAKQTQNCLYYATAVSKNGKIYAKQPWILDTNSVQLEIQLQKREQKPAIEENNLVCPSCGKKCSSKSGLTLHIKNSDGCRLDQKVEKVENGEDVVMPVLESKTEPPVLSCPFCGKITTSTPGRTLHIKSAHPDKLEEYHKWLKQLGKK